MDTQSRKALDNAMARLATGDREAFHSVFQSLWPIMKSYCTNMLGDPQEGEDAAQQALEKVFANAIDYDAARPALPWALGIAAWECRTLRKQCLRRKMQPIETSSHMVDSGDTPEDVVSHNELIEAAVQILGTLSEADQHVMIQSLSGELKGGLSATLRKRKERALRRLRNMWSKLYGEV